MKKDPLEKNLLRDERGVPGIKMLLEKAKAFPLIGDWLEDRATDAINETFRGFATLGADQVIGWECNSGLDPMINPLVTAVVLLPEMVVPVGAGVNPLWAMPGGKKIWGVAKNDSQWMQIWAFTIAASKDDDSERKVAIARRKYGDVGTTQTRGVYIAQAEFYFDCTSSDQEWDDVGCNGYSAESQLALYNMRWRARLRRYHAPNFQALIVDQLIAWADGLDLVKKTWQGFAARFGLPEKIQEVTDIGELIRKALDSLIDDYRDKLTEPPDETTIFH